MIRSERNQDQLETVLQSLVFYANNSQAPVIRQATNILSRLVICWLEKITVDVDKSGSKKGPNGNGAVNQQTSLVGFENFVYKTLVGLVFEVPSKPDFDFTDAQSQIVSTGKRQRDLIDIPQYFRHSTSFALSQKIYTRSGDPSLSSSYRLFISQA